MSCFFYPVIHGNFRKTEEFPVENFSRFQHGACDQRKFLPVLSLKFVILWNFCVLM